MLELKNLTKTFGDQTVLSDVNLIVPTGKTHALIGSSGSGKTTLLRITLGLIDFDRGWIKINDQALLSFAPSDWADQIGYVPQEGGLFPHLTAERNVTLVARLRGWSKAKLDARLAELGQLVEIEPTLLNRFPSELSGGQRQRIAIMRAAFLNPQVMLLDEPMGALDPLVRRSLQEELRKIFKALNKTVIIVTHDLSEAAYLAETLTLLHEGKVIQTGTYEDLYLRPAHEFVTYFIQAQRTLPEVKTS